MPRLLEHRMFEAKILNFENFRYNELSIYNELFLFPLEVRYIESSVYLPPKRQFLWESGIS